MERFKREILDFPHVAAASRGLNLESSEFYTEFQYMIRLLLLV